VFYYLSKIVWFFATPSNLLPSLILVGVLLTAWKRARRLGIVVALSSTVMLLIAGLSPLSNWVILPLEERFPSYEDDGRPIAGIIVLGGAVQAEEALARGQLTVNEAGERVIALADLARRYPAAKLVFSGGGSTFLRDEIAESTGLAHFLETLGIAREQVLFEDRSRTTRENALFTHRLVEPKPGERWLLVTSGWHMPRAVGCFRQVGFDVTAYPVDFRTRGSQDRQRPFAFASEGLRQLDLATKEWAGLIGYRLAGYLTELFPSPR
jgi:uncharacterized SAM-binding protein YcdF (DUF218 family)